MTLNKFDREQPPANYELTVENFDILRKSKLEYYDSEPFAAAGHQWRLRIYPNGDTRRRGNDHISFYLVIDDSGKLLKNFQIVVHYRLFCLNQNENKYTVIEDENMGQSRFNPGRREHGFAQFLTQKVFYDAAQGYLVDNKCVFGAEVFKFDAAPKRETLVLVPQQRPVGYLQWRINLADVRVKEYDNSVTLNKDPKDEWRLVFYPNGDYHATPNYASLFLEFVGGINYTSGRRVYADYTLRVVNHFRGVKHREETYSKWFSKTDNRGGDSKFMEVSQLHQTNSGFVTNIANQDILVVELEIHTTSEFFVDDN